MIAVPAGWNVRRDGALLCLEPTSSDLGRIRYLERATPLASVTAIAAALLGTEDVIELGDPIHLETDEGEYAMRLSAVVRRGDAPCYREIGIIFLDESYALLDATGFCADRIEELRAALDRLIRSDVHARGERPRRCRYQPPKGWRSTDDGRQTTWINDRDVALHVWRAIPRSLGSSASDAATTMLSQDADAGFVLLESPTESALQTARGLVGGALRIRGEFPGLPATDRSIVVLEDGAFTYMLKLETLGELAADDIAELDSLLDSLEPIPTRAAAKSDAFLHWAA